MKFSPGLLLFAFAASAMGGPRINQEGRILGPKPAVTEPILFNTPAADAVVSAMQIMPVTSAWNEDVSRLPLLSNSAAMISEITSDLASNRRTLRPFYEMNYVLVPDDQSTQSINFFNYPGESDLDGGTSLATFGNTAQAATTAQFSLPGTYTLMLSADDGTHAVAYDAITIRVVLASAGCASGRDFVVQFPTLAGRKYRVEECTSLSLQTWTTVADKVLGNGGVVQVMVAGALNRTQAFYRVNVLPPDAALAPVVSLRRQTRTLAISSR